MIRPACNSRGPPRRTHRHGKSPHPRPPAQPRRGECDRVTSARIAAPHHASRRHNRVHLPSEHSRGHQTRDLRWGVLAEALEPHRSHAPPAEGVSSPLPHNMETAIYCRRSAPRERQVTRGHVSANTLNQGGPAVRPAQLTKKDALRRISFSRRPRSPSDVTHHGFH